MISSPCLRPPAAPLHGLPSVAPLGYAGAHRGRDRGRRCRVASGGVISAVSSSSASFTLPRALRKSVPLAASAAILLWCHPVDAGILSGFSGLESIPGPELPQMDFLKQWSEEKQKKYEELDSRFKSSPVLKQLLEKSKLNRARNQRALQDKYCMRGAEWGVGDCSTEGMTQEERDNFIAELKKRIGD